MSEQRPIDIAPAATGRDTQVSELKARLRLGSTVEHEGRVVKAMGTAIRVSGLPARIGQRCSIQSKGQTAPVLADVVGIDQGDAILVPLGLLQGIAVDSVVRVASQQASVFVSKALLGRVLDGFGEPLDDLPANRSGRAADVRASAPSPFTRTRITAPIVTGVRAIDSLLTIGVGQRIGLFAPAGVGKTSLLAMMSARADVDVIVVGLVGERGREVREFLDESLESDARERTVVVVSTSDRPAMERVSAANTATAIAEGFRVEGKRVLLLIDSVTRYARALREVGLAVGEPPVRQGFPPSVFAELPRLFERSGNDQHGSITAFYTVLTEVDAALDPIAEETRSILDGHIVLSRKLAEKGHYPAIDVLASTSRLFTAVSSAEHQDRAQRFRELLSKYNDIEFLVQVGEYERGQDALGDQALDQHQLMHGFLKQSMQEHSGFDDAIQAMSQSIGLPPVGDLR
ncbi:MAG: FliI/YscN family ATPase [Granulosicoccus sp.]